MNDKAFDEAAREATRQGLMERIIDGVVGRALSTTGVQTVFGDPVREEDRTVIPVARIKYRFGFGAGTGPPENPDDPPPGGGGGGGDMTAKPVGFIETTPAGSRFVPIIDWSQILTTAMTLAGLSLLMALWRSRSRHDPA